MKKEFIGSYKKYLNDYINYKRNLGFKYGNPHEYKLLEFDKYMSENNITTLTLDSIHYFINSKDVSGNTKATTATLLRGFTKYLFNENVIDFILPERIYVAKRSKIPYIFTNEEINLFFETLKDFYPNCKFKNDIIFLCFLLLYCTGMRVGECLSIKFNDIDFEQNIITLYNTKNNVDRNIVINDYIKEKIIYIKEEYKDKYMDNDYIFIRSDFTRYDSDSIYSIFRKIIYYSKIEKEGKTPRVHDFRFTFCVNCYKKLIEKENGQAYIPVLSAYVGHKDFKSTEYYLKLISELYPDIRKKVEKYTSNIIRELEDIDE